MIRRFELIIDHTQWVHFDEITNLIQDNFSPIWYMSSLTVEDFIQSNSWHEVGYSGFDPNDLQSGSKPCCGGGIGTAATYATGKWHDNECDSLKPVPLPSGASSPYAWVPSSSPQKVCECGADAVYGPGNGLHSATMPCPLYKKII